MNSYLDHNLWECIKCDFKTTDDNKAMRHEHAELNCTINLTEEQFKRAFGIK